MVEVGRFEMKEPFSGLSHMVGALLGAAALVILLRLSRGDTWMTVGFAIYGITLIVLYTASALYHLLPVGPAAVERLRKFDQCAIHSLIAGCYTPVCLIRLRDSWGWGVLAFVWGIALTGILTQLLWKRMPVWLHIVLYFIMAWGTVIGMKPVWETVGIVPINWLLLSCVIYTVGGIIFVIERPRLWPDVFGAHDLWHLFVLAGSGAHFMMMLNLIGPAATVA